MNPLFLSLTTLLLTITITTTTATPNIGVTFDPTTPNLPPLDSVITAIIHHNISTVRLINLTPSSVNAFSNTNINLVISVPNTFLHSFATHESSSSTWITEHIIPFYHITRISLISIDSSTTEITPLHLPALRNLYSSLQQLGIVDVQVSITFPFGKVVSVGSWFMPSQSVFYKPELTRDLVRFLKSMNSPFLIAVYPYRMFSSGYVPLGFALFDNRRFDMRTDVFTGIEYWNSFDMMVDALGFALEGVGEGNIRVIVAETGWPCETIEMKGEERWAPFYLYKLMDHLKKSGSKRVDEVYIYELFGDQWGIMNQELRLKYKGLEFEVEDAVTSEFMYNLGLCVWGVVLVSMIVGVGCWKWGKLLKED